MRITSSVPFGTVISSGTTGAFEIRSGIADSGIAEEAELGEDRTGNALRCGTLRDATRLDAAFCVEPDEVLEEMLGDETLGDEAVVETAAWFATLADDEDDATGWLVEEFAFSGVELETGGVAGCREAWD
jgi:hypothetical protein